MSCNRGKSAFFARRLGHKANLVNLEPLSVGGRNTRTVSVLPNLLSLFKETPHKRQEENKFMYSTMDTRQKVSGSSISLILKLVIFVEIYERYFGF